MNGASFKAKVKENNSWAYGGLAYTEDLAYIVYMPYQAKDIIDGTICENTRHKDKRGVDVYENDYIAVTKVDKHWVASELNGEGIPIDWEQEEEKTDMLFRIIRGEWGFYADLICPKGEYKQTYGIDWVVNNGKVVGNYFNDEDPEDILRRYSEND